MVRADPIENRAPQVPLNVSRGLVPVDKGQMLVFENCTHVLQLVLDRAARSGGQDALQTSVHRGLNGTLSATLCLNNVEICGNESLDLPSAPWLAGNRLIRLHAARIDTS